MLTPKPSSEVDTELEEEIQGGMAGPSSLSAQHQRRRLANSVVISRGKYANLFRFLLVQLVQSNEGSLMMSLWNQVSIWVA